MSDAITLNHYLATAGIASRRKAAELITQGAVAVDGTIITEPGFRVTSTMRVTVNGMPVKQERKIYLLLRKPAGYITTLSDEQDRPTVMTLLHGVKERVVPVGRLDQQTTGVLLLTNDGYLAQRLAHPSHGAIKEYYGTLDQELQRNDVTAIREGVFLEDGKVQVESIIQPANASRKKFIVRIKSGRNRVIRRLFAHFGYNVVKLDRSRFAGISYKGLKEGEFRLLTRDEVQELTANLTTTPVARQAKRSVPRKTRSQQTKYRQTGLKTRRGQATSRRNP